MTKKLCLIITLIIIVFGLQHHAATAQGSLRLNILDVNTRAFPLVRITFDAVDAGGLAVVPGQVQLLENGTDITVLNLSREIENDMNLAVVLCVDISGSMRNAIRDALNAAAGFLEHLDERDTVALVMFGREVHHIHGLTGDKQVIADYLKEAPALEPATVFYDALKHSIELLGGVDNAYRTIVALSDGEENSSTSTMAEIIALAQEHDVRIFNIGLVTPDLDPELLRAISEQTAAAVVIAPTRQDLASVYNNVAAMIQQFYTLSYRSKASPGDEVIFSLTVRDGDKEVTVSRTVIIPGGAPKPVEKEQETVPAVTEPPKATGLPLWRLVTGILLVLASGAVILISLQRLRLRRILTVPGQFLTIQEAVDKAKPGWTVVVSPGIYRENLDLKGKNITVRSSNPTNKEIVSSTVLDGRKSGSTVTFGEKSRAVFSGFTIKNGNAVQGGGVLIYRRSRPTITHNVITGNVATKRGGGVFIGLLSAPRFSDNIIRGNEAPHGGGLYIGDDSRGELKNNQVKGNKAEIGGGIAVTYGSSPKLSGNQISENEATLSGGGIDIRQQSKVVLSDNNITGNKAPTGGGVIFTDSPGKEASGKLLQVNKLADNHPDNLVI